MSTRDSASTAEHRTNVAAAAVEQHQRLRWRHSVVKWIGLVPLSIAGLAFIIILFSSGKEHDNLVADLPVVIGMYVGGAAVVAFAIARFRPLGAIARFPVVLAFGFVGAGLFMLIAAIGRVLSLVRLGGAWMDFAWSRARLLLGSGRTRENLASIVVDHQEATGLLGPETEPADTRHSRWLRASSVCTYVVPQKRSLIVVVAEGEHGQQQLMSRLPPGSELVPGLGRVGIATPYGLVAMERGWTLSLIFNGAEQPPREKQFAIARGALDALPDASELGRLDGFAPSFSERATDRWMRVLGK